MACGAIEAKDHREMAAAYARSTGSAHQFQGQKEPWVVKMEKHCGTLAGAADQLAADNEKAAEYHTLRGKELQGK